MQGAIFWKEKESEKVILGLIKTNDLMWKDRKELSFYKPVLAGKYHF